MLNVFLLTILHLTSTYLYQNSFQFGKTMESFLKKKQREPMDTSDGAAPSNQSKKTDSVPWVEKYRPTKIEDVSHQDEVLASLKPCLTGSDLPHMLFYGPPGTGKTTTILAFCRQLYGNNFFRERVLELNASDERGINIVREKIKTFASTAVSGTKPDGTPCPRFKIVILDEADSMTKSAQSALRRTMEVHSKSTRFCLICNYVSRIIDPITSRCAKYRFKPLNITVMKERLKMVCDNEDINIHEEAIDELIKLSEGDMRKAMTFLQCVSKLRKSGQIARDDILSVLGGIENDVIRDWMKTCFSGSFDSIDEKIRQYISDGYPAGQLLSQAHDLLMESDDLNDKQKSSIFETVGVCEKRLMDGASEYLQLLDFSCAVMNQASAGNN